MERTMYFNSENNQVYTAKVTLSNNVNYAKIGKSSYFIDEEKKEVRIKYNTKFSLPKKYQKIEWRVPLLVSIAKGRSVRAKGFTNVPDSTDNIWALTESGQLRYIEFKKVSLVDEYPPPKKAPMKVVPKDEPKEAKKTIPQNSAKAQDVLEKHGISTEKGTDPTPKPDIPAPELENAMDLMKAVNDEGSMTAFLLALEVGGITLVHKQSMVALTNVRYEMGRKVMVIKGDTLDGERTFKGIPGSANRYFKFTKVVTPGDKKAAKKAGK